MIRQYTSGAEMFGTPVHRLTSAMVGGAAKAKTAPASISSAQTERSSGSRQLLRRAGSLKASETAIAAAGM